MMVWAGRNNRGFTLVETITASAILSATALIVIATGTQSLGGARLNRQYEVAAAIADRQLTMVDYLGVENFIELGETEGDIEGIEPGYHWQVITELLDIDNLYQVRVTVTWAERKRVYSLSVDTMLNGTGMLIVMEQSG